MASDYNSNKISLKHIKDNFIENDALKWNLNI